MNTRRFALSVLLSVSLVAAAVGATLPRPAATLIFNLPDGQKLDLAQYKGKVVAMCFILTTCPHCQKTVGVLTKAQKDYAARGFQVVAAAIEQDAIKHVPNFVQQFGVNFPVGATDPMTAVNWFQHPLAVNPLMPMLAFVDRKGAVRAQYEGNDEKFFNDQQEQNIRAQIEALLKESATPAKKASAAPVKKPS